MKRRGWVVSFVLVAACSSAPAQLLAPPPEDEGFQLGMDIDVGPGEEAWRCQVMPLDVSGLQNVNHVRHVQTTGVHHMDIGVILYSGLNEPPGQYDCKALYSKYPKLMDEMILYGSQAATGDITLPPGVVAKVPGGLTLLFELHLVNATPKALKVSSRVNAYTIDSEAVTGSIWGGAVRDYDISIPARSEHVEWNRCAFDHDVDVLLMSSHTHQLGREVRISTWDGKNVGDQVYSNTDWQSPNIFQLHEPLHVKQGEGFQFECHYRNDGDAEVHWGTTSTDEMCNMVTVFTPGESMSKCVLAETSDGKLTMSAPNL
jgi:hypothetical protein